MARVHIPRVDRLEIRRGGVDGESLGLALDVIGAGIEDHLHEGVLGGLLGGDGDHPSGLEHVGHAARVAEVAVVLREEVADLGDGADTIDGRALDEEGDTSGAVALEGQVLVGRAIG